MFEQIAFWIFLVAAILVAVSATGILNGAGSTLASVKWIWVIRVILGIIFAIAICYALCYFGVVAGVIGLIAGFILGMCLPSIVAFAWKVLKWWGILIFVVIIVVALIAVLF